MKTKQINMNYDELIAVYHLISNRLEELSEGHFTPALVSYIAQMRSLRDRIVESIDVFYNDEN